MSGESWFWVGLLAFLVLCCVLPMLFMGRFMRGRGRGDADDGNGRNRSRTKP